jgi:hypothetical protein
MLAVAPLAANGYYNDKFKLSTTISCISGDKGVVFDAAVSFVE